MDTENKLNIEESTYELKNDRTSFSKTEKGGVRYIYHIETGDAFYAPPSKKDIEELSNKIDKALNKLPSPRYELLYPQEKTTMNNIRIVILVIGLPLASILFCVGFFSPFVEFLPHKYFWWTMAFPCAGLVLANLINLLKHQ